MRINNRNKVFVILASLSLFFVLWGQYIYIWKSSLLSTVSIKCLAIFSVVLFLGYLSNLLVNKLLNSRSNEIIRKFASGLLLLFIFSVLSHILLRNITLDVQLHDTYLVVAFHHVLYLCALVFGVYLFLYYLVIKLSKRSFDFKMGSFHFWISILSAFFIIGQTYFFSSRNLTAGFYTFETYDFYERLANIKLIAFPIVFFVAVLQLFFLINIILRFIPIPIRNKQIK